MALGVRLFADVRTGSCDRKVPATKSVHCRATISVTVRWTRSGGVNPYGAGTLMIPSRNFAARTAGICAEDWCEGERREPEQSEGEWCEEENCRFCLR